MNAYARATFESPLALKRWTHAARFKTAIELLDVQPGERLLDFGCGDGALLEMLAGKGARLEGYDPHPLNRTMAEVRLSRPIHAEIGTVCGTFDAVACLEVLEHVPDELMDRTLAEIRSCLAPQGRCVISVPIEVGPVAMAKNLARAMLGAAHPGFRWRDALSAAAYQPQRVNRSRKGRMIQSHIGFDHIALRRRIAAAGFKVAHERFTPIGAGGHLMNSQVFWVLRHA